MTSLFVLSALLYLVWVMLYLQRYRIRKFLFSKRKMPPAITPTELTDEDIMGKTKTQLSQIVTNDDSLRQIEKPIENVITFTASKEDTRSAMVENNELDSVFSDSPEPMDLDIEAKYDEDDSQKEDDLICFVNDEFAELATGIRYDEMENLIQVMQQGKASPAAELSALNTIQELNQTELFQLMVAQIDGGKQRVANMLNKYNQDSLGTFSMNAETNDADFQKFEINNFL